MWDMSRSGGGVRSAIALLAVMIVSSSCAYNGSDTAVPAAPPSVPSTDVRAQDPPAPATYRPVLRSGTRRQATLKAKQGGFSTAAPVRYSDGVSLRIRQLTSRVEEATGPGAFPKREYVTFGLSLDNRSRRALDLSQVVVTAVYGVPGRLAQPVYEDGVGKDFAGAALPGKATTAAYSFAIPKSQRGDVNLIVDIDGVHVPAEFRGAAR